MKNQEKILQRKAYFHSDCSIPAKMILASLKIAKKEEKIDPIKEIEECANILKESMYTVRINFPNLSIEEWYLVAISCYMNSFNGHAFISEIIGKIRNSDTKTWIEFKKNNPEISKISEKIFLLYKKMRGKK